MTKVYCDLCGTEVEQKDLASVNREYETKAEYGNEAEVVHFRVIHAIGDEWNKGDICLECLAVYVPRAISKRIREQNVVRG